MAEQIANQLKERGNTHFKQSEYDSAILCYTQAIAKNPSNPVFYTNRANARLKLRQWSEAMDDCIASIGLQRTNLKAFRHLAVAQLELGHPSEALTSAITAYNICSASTQHTADAFHIAAFVLQCKRAKWDLRENDRLRRRSELLRQCEDSINRETQRRFKTLDERAAKESITALERSKLIEEVRRQQEEKIGELRTVFALANPDMLERREVPDYLVDDISFEIMHDPVVTKEGHSYERATIIEHLKRNPVDPLSRKPLSIGDLRTNHALKKACDEFWDNNKGWAIDW